MSTLRNCVQLIGRLGVQPTVRKMDNGQKLAKFSMATTDTYKGTDGTIKEETYWHQIVGWGKIAERMEKYLSKGCFVLVEGKLTHREYIDPKGNIKKYFTEVKAGNFILLDKKDTIIHIMDESQAENGLPF